MTVRPDTRTIDRAHRCKIKEALVLAVALALGVFAVWSTVERVRMAVPG